ncbi:hypothetical protein C447_03471 [Halococcus hamelinensis 100A6]|uniref:Uncharacterized protein n=2 Tax=Halococcus hamelinensis TaxID=332168 RepID=M0M4T2_9EURY|nr:hypothetical protein C447_03471 [Halococcus hamelinensis 100A6]
MGSILDEMVSSRMQAVSCLVSVVIGGAILLFDSLSGLTVSSGEYSVSLGPYGFLFLVLSVALLAGDATGRTRILGSAGWITGLCLIIVVDGLVALGPYIYDAGVVVLVVTGAVLFLVEFDFGQERNVDGS